MKLLRSLLISVIFAVAAFSQEAGAPAATPGTDLTTQAAAVVASGRFAQHTPDFLEHLVDATLELFDVRSSDNTIVHYVISALFLVASLLVRRLMTGLIFGWLRKLSARTQSTLDDKLLPALEAPASAFLMLVGVFGALKVLKLSAATDEMLGYGATVAFSLVVFWGLLRAFDALLDHAQEIALKKQMGVAAFMPWIKKSLLTIFVVFGVLMVVQSLGFDVKALLAGLGIGGLAFALAAQDALANILGSVVVAMDQPFKIGETIRIAGNAGTVEDIGLRSTKLRLADRSLVVIPNKTVAAETITNLSRFTARRVEQVFNLTYDATPEQLEAIVTEIRGLIDAEPAVATADTHVYFRDLSASSLDLWVAYVTKDPDFAKHMALRQRLNLAIMRAVAARGLEFAFPTQTVHAVMPPEKKGPGGTR
jgi:MscS family membrane protein